MYQLVIAGYPKHHLYFPVIKHVGACRPLPHAGPYNFSVPTGEDQYFVTNFAVLGVLKSGGPVVFFCGKGGRERIDVTIFYGEDLGGVLNCGLVGKARKNRSKIIQLSESKLNLSNFRGPRVSDFIFFAPLFSIENFGSPESLCRSKNSP